jgi:outer membrane protein TolC
MRVTIRNFKQFLQNGILIFLCILFASVIGCAAAKYRENADKVASEFIRQAQLEALGRTEPFSIEPPSDTLRKRLLLDQNLPFSGAAALGVDELPYIDHWPEKDYPVRTAAYEPTAPPWEGDKPLKISLVDSLQIAAANNREYQTTKENIFQAALILDLESNKFRNTFFGVLQSLITRDQEISTTNVANSASAEWTRQLKTGAKLSTIIFMDLVHLLTQNHSSSRGIFVDATISIPLLAGSGEYIVAEPLTQAERNLSYSLYTFARFKRTLAVQVASEYLTVLDLKDQLKNEEENYRRLFSFVRNASRLSGAGRLPKIQVDQAYQDVLRARVNWISAQKAYANRLDTFKITLGLPTDALIELDQAELDRLALAAKKALGSELSIRPPVSLHEAQGDTSADAPVELVPPSLEGGGPLELEYLNAIEIALEHRMDLRIAQGEVYDAQRAVVVAADALRANLTLLGNALVGERRLTGDAELPNAQLRVNDGIYSGGIIFDFPWERTEAQDAYRNSYITLQRAVRNVQETEDQIKFQLRNELRSLIEARENYKIQTQAVDLASRRVKSSELFLQAGRAETRDVLDAQESLVSTQNALTRALVNYRISELELQRDMGVLEVDHKGIWNEYEPKKSD